MPMTWCEWKSKENCHVLVNQFHRNFRSETLGCRKTKSVFRDVKWCFIASWGLKELSLFHLWYCLTINPLTAGAAYFRVFIFLLAHLLPPLKHVKDKIRHQSAIFENSWPPFCQIWIIFTHLKLWIASARHNFKWVIIQIEKFGG